MYTWSLTKKKQKESSRRREAGDQWEFIPVVTSRLSNGNLSFTSLKHAYANIRLYYRAAEWKRGYSENRLFKSRLPHLGVHRSSWEPHYQPLLLSPADVELYAVELAIVLLRSWRLGNDHALVTVTKECLAVEGLVVLEFFPCA